MMRQEKFQTGSHIIMRKRRKLLVSIILLVVLFLLIISYCDNQVQASSENKLFSDIQNVPHNHVGLLPGTGKYLAGGYLNPYYQYRIDAAAQLFKAGKINYLIISGDNSRQDYNEPEMMKADLVANGIDSCFIYLDYAGFRTFDSMIRLKKIFSQDSVTVISQEFHNQRALFIAQKEGIAAIGYNARDVSSKAGFKTMVREKFARVKVFVDYLCNTEPRFLGPKVKIPEN
jgi:SanA protein